MSTPDNPAATRPAKADASALAAGQTVFEYQIDKVLGCGGFGITYLAQDVNLQLPVALKEYFPADLAVRGHDQSVQVRSAASASQFDWGLERFIDEARTLASFRQPNIVRVLRYFKANGSAYIVMEYESGDPLKRWLGKQALLDQKKLLHLIYPLLNGLEAVHRLNFLHRDIKPDNIYIRADGTPVLLDFGAARRVSGNRDMTNIISPGFAPFEQYHSKGRQGPWTDLYSLGAVMYWMTTGKKPLESAARVRQDDMPKAANSANVALYGEALLKAIDWALMPDELQRPQDVTAFRQVLLNSECVSTQVIRTEVLPARTPNAAAEPLHKNVMGTIMFLDLVAYSTHSVDQQVVMKALFNELITKVMGSVQESSRIMLDTGDGAAICFLGDPEEALQSALLLRDLLRHKYGKKLSLRVGLHLGPIRMVRDINQRVNVVGDGINVAQRIMDFSMANQIVVSRAYYDVISRISDGTADLFNYLGTRQDKHQRLHDIYAVLDPQAIAPPPESTRAFGASALSHTMAGSALAALDAFSPEVLSGIEAELTQAIGPLAKVLVKKTLSRTTRGTSTQELRDLLALSITDAAAREAFTHPKSTQSVVHSVRQVTQSQRADASQLSPSQHSQSVSRQVSVFSAEQQAMLERALSQYVGPLAKTLVRREAARHDNLAALVAALARHIDQPDEQAKFLSAVHKH